VTEKITMLEGFMTLDSGAIAGHETAAADTSACILPFPPRVVRAPEDMALLLMQASPLGARLFAIQMHERACHGAHQTWADFWLHVIHQLVKP
jgi:hypothetical protein